MDLPHLVPQCTGVWHRFNHRLWRCSVCAAIVSNCAEAVHAIGQDAYIAFRLQELEQEGRQLLDQGRHR